MPEASLITADINGQPSYDDLRNLVRRALTGGADIWGPGVPYVADCADGNAIVEREGKHYRYPYTLSPDGESVELGVPVPARLSWRDVTGGMVAREPEAGSLAFATDLSGLQFNEAGTATRIEVCRDGEWNHASYGDIKVTPAMRASFVANFQANVREVGDLPLDYDHEAGPAPGWITGLVNEGSSLYADVSLTPSGRQKIEDGEYRFVSPEWHPDWKNPRTGVTHGPTLFGAAFTNKPFFRGMAAVQCSELSPGSSGATGAQPQRETGMESATQTGAETPVSAQQFAQMQERLTGLEADNAALRAREERNSVENTLATLKFSDGRKTLAPASRTAFADAVLQIPNREHRKAVLDALGGVQFADLTELGFVPEETTTSDALTAAEEQRLRETAERNGLKFDEVKASYLEVRGRRQGSNG